MTEHVPRQPPVTARARTWLDRWGPVLPLLVAEATVWAGFGALLPVLPIYFVERGIDLPTLGLIAAAWPAGRLVGEPVLGWVADRTSRPALMVAGLLVTAVSTVLPLFVSGAAAFVVLRAVAGLGAGAHGPAARGYLVDANPPARRGEAFGLYGAAQMGGMTIGPAIGGVTAALTGDPTVVFWVAGLALVAPALLLALRVRELPHRHDATADEGPGGVARPRSLRNRLLLAAVLFSLGSFFAAGTYEVVWSVWLRSLGAGLDLIGLTFVAFGLPVFLFAPFAGRFIDREGGYVAAVLGLAVVSGCAAVYALVPEIWMVVVLGFVEGVAFAFATPALNLLVARAAPAGRASGAQGIAGAAGTAGMIVASLLAGVLAAVDLRFPFLAAAAGMAAVLLLGLAIGGRRLWHALQPHGPVPAPAAVSGAVE